MRSLFNDIVGISKPKSPLVVRHDNSIGNITQRLSSDSKTPIPSSHSNMKRVSMGDIYSEKEKKALETRPENYQGQGTGEPDLNKRSYSINLSPPTHWNSRVTSKKISVCDFSQDIQDLQKEYDISIDRKNKGSISSRPSFDMYKEYMNRNLFSQNSSPFALYSEFAKPKKDIPQAYSANKLKFIDTRALDNSPVSIENRYLNKDRNGPKSVSKHAYNNVSMNVMNKTRSPTKKLDYSLENSMLDPVYQKLQNSKVKNRDDKTKVEQNEYSYKTPSKNYEKSVSVSNHILNNTHINATNVTQEKIGTNVSISTQEKDHRKGHPLLSGIHYKLFDQEKPTKFYIDEPINRSIPFLRPPKLGNTSIESIHVDVSLGEASMYERPRVSARRPTQESIIDLANSEISGMIWNGIVPKKDYHHVKTKEISLISHKGSLETIDIQDASKTPTYANNVGYLNPEIKHSAKTNNSLIDLENILPKSSRVRIDKTPKKHGSILKPEGDKVDEDFSGEVESKEVQQSRLSKREIEVKDTQIISGRRASQNDGSVDIKNEKPEDLNNGSRPAHKKNSKSWNSVNILEQIIKGLNLPITMPKANEGDNLTPNVSEFNTNNTSMLDRKKKDEEKSHDISKINDVTIQKAEHDERSDDEYLKEKLIKMIKETHQTKNSYPGTTLDYYRLIKMIGKGAFGKVFLGVHLLTGKHVAVKSIEKKYIKEESSQKKIFQEVLILKKMKHQKVIRLLEVFENKRYLFIVLEYASKGDMLRYVKRKGRLTEDVAKDLFKQIVSGLRYCHQNLVLHRDIKLDNILLDENKNVKICDFGVSRFVKKGQVIKEQCGTPAYIAPEIIRDKGYEGCYADIWSLGVVLYAMVTGTVPFKADNIEDLHKVILKGKYSIPSFLSENCKDLLSKMLKLNPYSRISIDVLDEHPWFEKVEVKGRRESISSGLTDTSQGLTSDHRRAYSVDKGTKTSLGVAEAENTIQIIDPVLAQVEELGFSRDFIINSLNSNSCNHAAASYYLLYEDYVSKSKQA